MKVFIAAFVLIFLKAMQQQNVVGGHYYWAIPTTLVMAAAEIAIVLEVVKGNWGAWPYMATGAALGVLLGMYIHRRFIGNEK